MKKWISILVCLGYLAPVFGTAHDTFLVTGEELDEISNYPHFLQTPSFFTQVYPKNLNPNLVLIPRTNRGFLFGITGSFQQAFDNQSDFAVVDFANRIGKPFFIPSLASSIRAMEPKHDFGFGAYMGYVFPYSGKDFIVDAFFIKASNSNSAGSPINGILLAPLPLFNQTIAANQAHSRQSIDIGQAKLLVGETIHAGTRLRLHSSFGLKYGGVKRRLTTDFTNALNFLQESFGDSLVHEGSTFNGIGPVVQLDGAYFFLPHFGLAGHAATAILIGAIKSDIQVNEDLRTLPSDIILPGNTRIDLKSTNRTVPNLDGKVGLVYEYPFCGSLVKMDLELGYQFNHFFNAVDTFRSAGSVVLVTADNLTTFVDTPRQIKHPHDLTIGGPYLSLGLSGITCPDNAVIDPICVTVPRLEGGFVLGISPIYYRVEANQRDFAIFDPNPVNIDPFSPDLTKPLFLPSLSSSLKDVQSDQAGGLMVTLGYILGDTPYDVTAHFEGAKSLNRKRNTRNTLSNQQGQTGIIWPILTTPFLNPIENRIFASEASSNLKFSYGEFHIDIGQAISAEPLYWVRLFEGVEFAKISQNFHVTYDNLTTVPIFPRTGSTNVPIPITFLQENIVQESEFRGIGPRIGIDLGLPMGNMVLVSELATAFLVGDVDARYDDEFSAGVLPNPLLGEPPIIVIPPGGIGTRVHSATQFSPCMDLKVALAYTWNFFFQTKWTVEVGYKAVHYFNSITTFRHVTNTAAVFAKQVGDVTLNGPYINFTVFGFGGCPPDCRIRDPFCVYVPELKGGFELAIEALYLRPHTSNIDYGIRDPLPTIVPNVATDPRLPDIFPIGIPLNPSSRSVMQVLKPNYDWGGKVHLGYIFPLTSDDVSLNFTSYRTSSSQSLTVETPSVIWTITNGNFGTQNRLGQTFFPVLANRVDASVKFDWETPNLEFGKRVKFHNLMTRFFAGVSYARIKEDISILYTDGLTNFLNPTPVFVPFDQITQTNHFTGAGPRLGVAGDLSLGCGFSLIGQIATDLLVGRFNSHFSEQSSFSQVAALNPDGRKRFAPELDGKFGLAYTVVLKNCSQAGLELGYNVNHYFNVKDSLRFTDFAATFVKQDQDISFDGLYVRLQINF